MSEVAKEAQYHNLRAGCGGLAGLTGCSEKRPGSSTRVGEAQTRG
jgi:hypothetical protein